ncbi:hypothetical protein, conserved [Plasmodium gonderi]|uniref:Uncharacterized protein n=1 Tax=Plasmodium gonderi TaxID=77519 RepID=A0A1Y1JGD2_PLAGO|nr:hypothetical protein, conserved [Plasmodium gonderi]GAW79503.1 hypothetical protein, conserved [Plasmodium gonderi]
MRCQNGICLLVPRDPFHNKNYHLAVHTFFFHSLQNDNQKRKILQTTRDEGNKILFCANHLLQHNGTRNHVPKFMQMKIMSYTKTSSMRRNTLGQKIKEERSNTHEYHPKSRIKTGQRNHKENDHIKHDVKDKMELEFSTCRNVINGCLPPEENHHDENRETNELNNLCKKIYYLSKNRVKNEKVWIYYINELYKEKKNFPFVSIKNLLLILLGITKSQYVVKDILCCDIPRGHNEDQLGKKTNTADIVDVLIDILSGRMNQMTNNQLSIFIHIIQKWNRSELYKDIIDKINNKILVETPLKKLSTRTFSNILHIYAKGSGKVTSNKHILQETINNSFIQPNGQANRIIKNLRKGNVRLEDILRLICAMYRLKIKNTELLEIVIQVLNDKVKEGSYFLTPSILLYLANLNIYNEELWKRFKMIIIQNYQFYNSVHLTNVFYGFSKFIPSGVEELFDLLASHIMHNFGDKCGKNEKILCKSEKHSIDTKPVDLLKSDIPTIWDNKVNKLNIFQITNIIKSCINCNYINYNFFEFLLDQLRKSKESQSLDNQIDSLKVISKILRTVNNHSVYKYVVYFHQTEKGNLSNHMEENPYIYLMNQKWIHKEIYTYISGYDICNIFQPMIYCNHHMGSKRKEEQNNFEIFLDEMSEKVREKIEQHLYEPQMKLLFHKLILCLSFSKVIFVNLYALCIIMLEENKKYFTINNLYFYVKIMHQNRVYNYELFSWIIEHVKKNEHLLDVKKKIKIILLSYNIFNKINRKDMQELCHFFLSTDGATDSGKEGAVAATTEAEVAASSAEGSSAKITPMWKIPESLNKKKKVVNLDHISNGSIQNCMQDDMCHFINSHADKVGSKYIDGENVTNNSHSMSEIEKDSNFSLTGKELFLNKIEKTDITPCHLDFNDYINFMLILIHSLQDDANGKFQLNSLISKGVNNIPKIKQMNEALDEHTKKLRKNLHSRRRIIIQLFEIFDTFLGKTPCMENNCTSLDDFPKPKDMYESRICQMMYILHFIKMLNEDVYNDIMKLQRMNKYKNREERKDSNDSKKNLFELKIEDLEFLNLSRNNHISSCTPHSMIPNNQTVSRYKYKSVHDTIDLFMQSFKMHKCTNYADVNLKNNKNDLHKMESYYKLNDFLISDIIHIFEKGKDKIFHFLLFYPHELKRTVVKKRENKIFLKHEYDESLIVCTEVIFFYNFLKKNFQNQFFFMLLDTTPFVKFHTCTNGDALQGDVLGDPHRVMHEASSFLEAIMMQ